MCFPLIPILTIALASGCCKGALEIDLRYTYTCPMTVILGLALIVLIMLTYGMGLVAALVLWAIAIVYVWLSPIPDMAFATWLSVAGLAAFVVQLALGLKPEEKKK